MKQDYATELHRLISDGLDRLFAEKASRPAYRSNCPNFYRTNGGHPHCRIGHNRKTIGMTKKGQPFELYLAGCRDCQEGPNNE